MPNPCSNSQTPPGLAWGGQHGSKSEPVPDSNHLQVPTIDGFKKDQTVKALLKETKNHETHPSHSSNVLDGFLRFQVK